LARPATILVETAHDLRGLEGAFSHDALSLKNPNKPFSVMRFDEVIPIIPVCLAFGKHFLAFYAQKTVLSFLLLLSCFRVIIEGVKQT
jgi:hypothetical protein